MVQELTCPGASPDCIPPTLAREFVYGRDFLEPVTMIDWTAAVGTFPLVPHYVDTDRIAESTLPPEYRPPPPPHCD